MARSWGETILRATREVVRGLARGASQARTTPPDRTPAPATRHTGGEARSGRPGSGSAAPHGARPYPGDYRGVPAMAYAPQPDGCPDPGEIVWTWVPFEEDNSVGKDRPVLLVGTDGDWLLGVALTSKDHDRDAAQEHRAGREWLDIGSGAWDSKGRPSEVRVNRIVRVDPAAVRREGAVMGEGTFEQVAAAIRAAN